MNTQTAHSNTHEYELRDIVNFASTDPRGKVVNSNNCFLSEEIAGELNYARALNGDPHRLIKVD